MQDRLSTGVLALLLLLAVSSTALAQNGKSSTNQGSTPNGKPFQQIQSQFAAVDEQLNQMNQLVQGLQTQIATVESNLQTQLNTINGTLTGLQTEVNTINGTLPGLQTQIDTINGTLPGLQTQIDTINGTMTGLQTQISDGVAATASLEARVTANEASIAALNTAVAALQVQLTAAQALIAGNTGDITALQGQVTNIQTLINSHTSQIATLQTQTATMNQFLTNLANGTCQTGQAIQDIAPGGFIVCTQAGGGNLQTMTVQAGFYLNYGNNYASVSCQPGYSATGSGFSLPSYYETTSVVTNFGYYTYNNPTTHYEYYYDWYYGSRYYTYTTYDRYIAPYWNTSYVAKSPVSVTGNMASGNYASLQVQYTPNYNYGYYSTVSVNCAKTQ